MRDGPTGRQSPAPPLRSHPAQPAGWPGSPLPRTLTTFVGREGEVATVRAMLARDDVRLLTLTGPGGVGKTRLALQVAEAAGADFADGVSFVDLSPVFDPAQVLPAIGRALGVRPVAGDPVADGIVTLLRDRHVLLVLDNLEQVASAGPSIVDLLHACPRLAVLATSRVALRVSGEHRFVVAPLGVPDLGEPLATGDLGSVEAVRLFVDRARATDPDLDLTGAAMREVAALCARLDGMPLAIELAAARVSVLSPREIIARLDARHPLLAGGPRDAPARLRSMRDSLAWSHDLLAAGERALFRQLGALVGTWTLEAAEAVAGADDAAARHQVLEHLSTLVEASLVQRLATGSGTGATMYRMLVPVREFAEELLARSDEAEVVRRRHAAFVMSLADQRLDAYFLPTGGAALERGHIHAPNIHTALAWLERQGDVDAMLRISGRLTHFWGNEGQVREGRTWLERAVASGRGSGSPHLGLALIMLGGMTQMEGDVQAGMAICREGRHLVEDGGDLQAMMLGFSIEGVIALRLGDVDHAVAMQKRALALTRSAPELEWTPLAESTVLGHLGNIAVGRGDIDTAERFFGEALEVQRRLGHEPGTSHIMASHPIAGRGDVARARGDLPAALGHYRHGLGLAHRFHDARATAYALGGAAGTLAAAGNWRAAARLFGADEALHERGGFHFDLETMDRQRALGLPEPWLRAHEPFGSGQPLRDALWQGREVPIPPLPDPATAAALWAEGRSLGGDAAVAEALTADLDQASANERPFGPSEREAEVLRELVTGKSDAEIASTLFISRRTVATHLQHVYGKLGVASRAEAAAVAVRRGLA